MKPKKLLSALITVLALTLTGCNSGSSPATPTYVVSFNSNGGSAVESQTIKENARVSKPENPTKNGYTFDNWTYAGEEWSFKDDKVTENITLDANWNVVNYSISYLLDGGTSEGNPTSYTIESNTVSLKDASKTGYTFTGWTDQNGNAISSISKGSYGDLVLTAHYSINSYAVSITNPDSAKGNVSGNGTYQFGSSVTITATPNTGYAFAGWSGYASSSSDSYTFTMPAKNVSFTVSWSLIAYSITYNLDGGTNASGNPTSFTVEDSKSLSDPTKTGYTFTGWTDQNGNTVSSINKGTYGDLVLTAHYTVNQYTNTYLDGFGNTIATITEDYGSQVTAPAIEDGYHDDAYCTFSGWDKSGYDTIGSSDTTYTATWNKVTYTFSGNTLTGVKDNKITTAIIPSKTPTGEEVTAIGSKAFYTCTSLSSVIIPDSVTSIGSYAFYNCYRLASITLGNSVTSIDKYAFSNCSSLTSITLGNSVTSIGSYAFEDCSSLTSIIIPNSVTSIGSYAFYGCSSLTSITLGNSVTSIGSSAFSGCSSLSSITIPNSVTSIGDCAFYNCSSFTSITIPDSVTSIGSYAFYNCSSLTSITLPFVGGSKTSNQYLGYIFGASSYSENSKYVPSSLKEVIISDGCTSIGNWAFYNCSSLTSITIPNSVTSIGSYAFSGCFSLKSITLGNSVTSIGSYAFYGCSSLKSITIPNSVTSIGYRAFWECSSLSSITLGNSVTSIGSYAFYGCSSLKSITIPNSVTSIGEWAFSGCSSLSSIVVDSDNKVYDSRNKCNAVIETSTNTLIVGCKNTTIPDTVTSIGSYAFEDCSSLTSIIIPNSVTSIGDDAFYNCTSLSSVYIGKNVTSIGSGAFLGCSSLSSIAIPDSVTSIGSSAFSDCPSLTIYCEASSQPSGWNSNWNPDNRPVVWGYSE